MDSPEGHLNLDHLVRQGLSLWQRDVAILIGASRNRLVR